MGRIIFVSFLLVAGLLGLFYYEIGLGAGIEAADRFGAYLLGSLRRVLGLGRPSIDGHLQDEGRLLHGPFHRPPRRVRVARAGHRPAACQRGARGYRRSDLSKDFSQADDVAAQHPDKLKELQAIFDREAKKCNVYPLDDRAAARFANPGGINRPSFVTGRTHFEFFPGAIRLPEGSAPSVKSKSHSIMPTS